MSLGIIHWNDVYRVTAQRLNPKSSETIDVTQFAAMVNDIRDFWAQSNKEGLTLFSGDVFSPSVESSVTRGSHMVPVMNYLAPDISLAGNHDFDFGYPHLSKLIKDTKFPWLLSNVVDTEINEVPQGLYEFQVYEKAGTRIGVIGLVEKEWIGTVSSWPPNFKYLDMKEAGIKLSQILRDPGGDHKCDIIIALTHARVPNDVQLAKDLNALSPEAQTQNPVHSVHGVDLILGGHDHLYYVSKGVTSWEGYDTSEDALGAEQDKGDVLVVKSGTDFRDLSELTLEFESSPAGSVRTKVIKRIIGKRYTTAPGSKSSTELREILDKLLSSVSSTLKAPVCKTTVTLDCRSQFVRVAESAAGNWFADVIRHAYDDALCMKGCGGSDGVFICAGTIRGDSMYGPGEITLGDIMEILPFEDSIVVLELDGKTIWDALEASLTTWPAQEGRFPVISGFRVTWDSRRNPGERVLGVWLTKEVEDSDYDGSESGKSTPKVVDDEPIERSTEGRRYKIVTRQYMAEGYDGFLPLKDKEYLIDDETGKMMSTIVRQYLLGSHYVNMMARLQHHPSTENLCESTKSAVKREQKRRNVEHRQPNDRAIQRWKHAAALALKYSRSKGHYQDHLNVSTSEHMSSVDPFDGTNCRTGEASEGCGGISDDLLVISPVVDGRLRDVGRPEQ